MNRATFVRAAAVLLLAGTAALADLAKARSEPNLEKRSQLALENAEDALDRARDAYRKGDLEAAAAQIAEIGESVTLAAESLEQTGKDPRRSPKWFKRAEIKTRELLKRLSAFDQDMSVADRAMLTETRETVRRIHDDLLTGLMEGRRS